MKQIQIVRGDSANLLKKIPDNFVDLIATDPPYAISFANHDWDKALIPVPIWKDCLRVLKPGAFAFVMSSPRQDVLYHQIQNLEQAGFEIPFTSIYWTYASGFTKAMDIAKKIDKDAGVKRTRIGPNPNYRPNSQPDYTIDGNAKNFLINAKYRTVATTPLAKTYEGAFAGFQPKPAVECIIVCMKPLSEKNYYRQALANRKGVTWLERGRIPYKDDKDKNFRKRNVESFMANENDSPTPSGTFGQGDYGFVNANPKGRYAPNLLVSGDVLNDGKDHHAGQGRVGSGSGHKSDYFGTDSTVRTRYDDKGSFSRYFDLDAWWHQFEAQFAVFPKPSDREKWCWCKICNLPFSKATPGIHTEHEVFCKICNKHGRMEDHKNPKGKKKKNKLHDIVKNWIKHPTQKPLALFCYLISLGSERGDIILDPFLGSGTTAVASKLTNRRCIGFERGKIFVELARARVADFTPKKFKKLHNEFNPPAVTIDQFIKQKTDTNSKKVE